MLDLSQRPRRRLPTARHAGTRTTPDSKCSRRVVIALVLVVAGILAAPTAMSLVGRLCLAVFVVMLGTTAFTKLNEVAVCSATLAMLVLIGGSSVADVTGSATGTTVWLLVGAFIVAAAAKVSGIAQRLAFTIGRGAATVDGLLLRITGVLIATAFIVPSTSGRAALMLPVYLAFAERIDDRRVRRALAVLFPSAILLSAVASLFGAGAHLVTVEMAVASGGASLGFLEWAIYGFPFAVASSLIALIVVRATFLDSAARSQPVDLSQETPRWSRQERIITFVLAALMATWLTEGLHPVPAWAAALIGAAVVTVGPLRVISPTEARSALPIDLLFIMIATAEAGAALARSGAADWIASALLSPLVGGGSPVVAVVLIVGLVSLLSHLVITSRTARASVLIPVVVLVAGAGGLDVTALSFLSTAAAGYCLSTTTSAKPIRVFSTVDDGYDETDLRRLSLRLLPLHVLLLLAFAFVVWPALGLALERDRTTSLGESGTYPWTPIIIEELDVGPRIDRSPVDATGETGAEHVEEPTSSHEPVGPTVVERPAGLTYDGVDEPDEPGDPDEDDLPPSTFDTTEPEENDGVAGSAPERDLLNVSVEPGDGREPASGGEPEDPAKPEDTDTDTDTDT